MLVATLDTRNPQIDTARTADLRALYLGGECWDARATRFLPQRPAEPEALYQFRLKSAHYLNYSGPIVDYFASALFTGRLEMRPRAGASSALAGGGASAATPEWLGEWKEDCDGLGTDFVDFLRDRLGSALVKGHSWALVDFPTGSIEGAPQTRAEWIDQGLDKGFLVPLECEDVLSHKCDRRGKLQWAIVKWVGDARENPGDADDIVVEQWTIWTREAWERWELRWSKKDGGRPDPQKTEATKIGGAPHTLGAVPLVCFDVPAALWIMNRIASPQIEQTRVRNAESWGLQRTCFAMRILKLKDKEDPPAQGPGYSMIIGTEEDAVWDAPPATAFEPIATYAETLKDEIYRVTHQMALGVKNNASAVGRSADSKAADNDATETVLRALAPTIREGAEKILDLMSAGRGETDTWHVTGLDSFAASDIASIVDNAIKLGTLSIPSPTWHRLNSIRVAHATVPDASQSERDQIVDEIEKNTPKEVAVPNKLGEPLMLESPDGEDVGGAPAQNQGASDAAE